MTAPKTQSFADEMNANRVKYGFAPLTNYQELIEERACDKVAEIWARTGRTLDDWREAYPEMVEMFAGEISYRTNRIPLCDIVDTWEEDFSLNADDFQRLSKEIEGWIVSHSSARGKIRMLRQVG